MSKELTKIKELSTKIKAELAKAGLDIAVGDIFIDNRGEKIIRINKIERRHNEYFQKNKHDADYVRQHPEYSLYIHIDKAKDWEANEWSRYGCESVDEFKDKYQKINGTVAEWHQKALDVIEGKISIDSFSDKSTDKLNEETAIMGRSNKDGLLAMQRDMEQKHQKVELIKSFVSYEMEKRKQALEKIRSELGLVLKDFEKKIERIMRVITTIELYLGIEEEIFQIQDGEKAPVDTPISFRQMVLYMDEETGIHEDGGLDFTNIKVFDEWLQDPKHLEQVLPEKKGIVVFAPRRKAKDYKTDDIAWEAAMNEENLRTTYMLIRNGDCLYRIYTSKITILPRLFPKRKELMEMLAKHEEITSTYSKEESEKKIEDSMYQYRKRAVLLQGLLDRTEIFNPLPRPLSIFKMDECADMVNFIYDDEASLPSGRLTFWDWHKEINSKIEIGSRVLITNNFGKLNYYSSGRTEHNYADRWYKKTASGRDVIYTMPQSGIYEVQSKIAPNSKVLPHYTIDELEAQGRLIKRHFELKDNYDSDYLEHNYSNMHRPKKGVEVRKFKKDKEEYIEAYYCEFNEEHMVILYNPMDEVYVWGEYDSKERKNRVSFRIYPEDNFVLNYDQISLDDIDFYINSRADRENYLELMPLLKDLKKQRLKEIENEKHFAEMVKGELLKLKPAIFAWEHLVWEAIDWWKLKNKYKRPIDKDDAKALRMIVKYITNKK